MEARFRESQDTLTLLEAMRGIRSQRPQGEGAAAFLRRHHLRNLVPEDKHQEELFGDPDNRVQLSTTMDKLNLKYGHTTVAFRQYAARARVRADAYRFYADPGAVWRGLYVKQMYSKESQSWSNRMQHSSFEVINLSVESATAESYNNHSIAKVNDHEIRISTMTEAYHWHCHPDSDESFLALEGASSLILMTELSSSCQGT